MYAWEYGEPASPKTYFKRYSVARVRNLYREIYGLDVVLLTHYKDRRRFRRYRLVDVETGEIVLEPATLYALGRLLEENGDY